MERVLEDIRLNTDEKTLDTTDLVELHGILLSAILTGSIMAGRIIITHVGSYLAPTDPAMRRNSGLLVALSPVGAARCRTAKKRDTAPHTVARGVPIAAT